MNKTLVALAALACAGTVGAQSSVTIYGSIDNAYTRVTNKGGASVSGLTSGGGGSIGSRLGFKGEEDLGMALKASFHLEMGLETSSGANGVPGSSNNITSANTGALRFDRRATVSLTSPYGELRLGRDLAVSFINNVVYDPFVTYGVGSSLNFPLGVVADGTNAASLFRISNAISYITPNIGGLTAQLQFAPSEQASDTGVNRRDGRYFGGRVAYDQGPLSVSASAGKARQTLAGGLKNDRKAANVGASFDFGVAKAMGEFARFTVDNSTGVAGQNLDTDVFTLGVVAPVGPGNVKVGYSRATREVDGLAFKPRTQKLAVGYDYNLSKRTTVYTTVARVNNSRDNSGFNLSVSAASGGVAGLSGGGGQPGVNSSSSGLDVGIRHNF